MLYFANSKMAWFKDWFNSPYYHILYGKRDEREAETLVGNLLSFLKPVNGSVFLDLACGKGRHTRQIASHGFEAYGIDLSEESIKEASEFADERLHFEVHDMRVPYKSGQFDYVFNLFTSFGYFSNTDDNLATLRAVGEELKIGATLVQDYFNVELVKTKLKAHELKTVQGIEFEISKIIEDKMILKTIKFEDKGVEYRFCEQVCLFDLDDFKKMYEQCGLKIKHVFGNYSLQSFDPHSSERLILISEKI